MITGLPPTPLVASGGGVFAATGSSLSVSQAASSVTITPVLGTAAIIPAASDTLAGALDAARATIIDNLAVVASSGKYSDLISAPDRHAFFSLLVDGGGAVIVTPVTRFLYMPFACTITGWAMLADRSGSATVDIWKVPLANYPPTVSNSITGGFPMTITTATNNVQIPQSANWTTAQVNIGDVIAFNVSSVTTIQVLDIQLIVTH